MPALALAALPFCHDRTASILLVENKSLRPIAERRQIRKLANRRHRLAMLKQL